MRMKMIMQQWHKFLVPSLVCSSNFCFMITVNCVRRGEYNGRVFIITALWYNQPFVSSYENIWQMMETNEILYPEKRFGDIPGWLVVLYLYHSINLAKFMKFFSFDSCPSYIVKYFLLGGANSCSWWQVLKLGISSMHGLRWLLLVFIVTGWMELITWGRVTKKG